MQTVRIDAHLQWRCLTAKGGNWVGVCDPLRITIQAGTWGELMEDIAHSLDAFFKELLTENELQTFLQNHGWTMVGPLPRALPKPADFRFDVPFFPVLMNSHGSQRDARQ